MKKKLLLFVLLLAGLTNVHAQDNGTLTVANIKNVVPGYSGSFDIVLSGASVTYCAYQFNLAMPEGLTYTSYSNGALLTNHTADVTDHTTYLTFIGESTSVDNFTSANGTLVTIYFTVAANASGTLTGGSLTTNVMSDNQAVAYHLADANFSIPVGNTVTLSEDETAAPSAISGVDVTVERTLKAYVWNTICLPFDMNADQITSVFGAGTQVAAYNGDDAEYDEMNTNVIGVKMKFVSASTITAHTPYIIKVPSAMDEFTVSNVNITTAGGELKTAKGTNMSIPGYGTLYVASDMIGTYEKNTSVPSGNLYLIDNEFKFSQGNTKLKAFRAYFDVAHSSYIYSMATSSSAPAITLDIDGNTTGISALELDADKTADSYYTVQGLQVAQPSKGLYIVNGRKVIIK